MDRSLRLTYYSLHSAMHRCSSKKNASYDNYGKRGITVCDRWIGKEGFKNFVDDMGVKPDGMSLDRINNDLGYSPDNCRWATKKEQQRNRRSVRIIDGLTLPEYCELHDLNRNTILKRINAQGYTLEQAIKKSFRRSTYVN